jgi:protein O-GlcNAc transferase
MDHLEQLRDALAAGDLPGAARYAEAALAKDPGNAALRGRLGSIRLSMGEHDAGIAALRLAAEASPRSALLWNDLGVAIAGTGASGEAERILRRALMLGPDVPEIHNNYGNVLKQLGEPAKAMACYEAALRRRPDYLDARTNLGLLLLETGDRAAALECFDAILAVRPDDAATWGHKAATLSAMGRYAAAEEAFRRAIVADPGRAATHNNYAILLNSLGRTDESRASYTRAIAYAPGDPGIHSNYLMSLCYDSAIGPQAMVAAHREWARRFAPPGPEAPFDLPAEGPLRVGYVSPDFHEHSVAYFLDAVFRHHDPARISVYAYSDVANPDRMTAALREKAAQWRDTRGDSDAALFDRIRADRIQVLVDLAGHTSGNRLRVFARRAAPVQVSWLGYGATTGLAQVDYRLADGWTDPDDGEAEAWWTERLWRLPGGYLCYSPSPSPLPPERRGGDVIFGSFNNLAKLNPAVVALWARVLNAVSGSRLLLKAKQLADPDVGGRLRAEFAAHGVDPARLEFADRVVSREEHLAMYGRVDVALDTFPWNGVTTSCEALWMGTPVVTLAGDRSTARYGVTVLTNAGFGEWIAESPDGFVDIAGRLAAARPQRSAVRARMAASRLTDGARGARELEDALLGMWRCRQDGRKAS